MLTPPSGNRLRRAPWLTALAIAAWTVATGCTGHTLTPRITDTAFSTSEFRPLEGPSARATSFSVSDDAITLWVHVDDLAETHTIRVRWHDPLDRVQHDSGPVTLNPEGGYRKHAAMLARLPIRGGPASLVPGTWRAEVLWDERPLLARTFTLGESP